MNHNQTVKLYMDLALRVSQESYCERLKVGAAIVTTSHGVFLGFNGTPSGFENVCELPNGKSNSYVVHAEENALSKMLKEGVAAEGSTLYVTHSPCIECTKMLYSAGIRRVFFKDQYKSIEHLQEFIYKGMKFWKGNKLLFNVS